MKHLSTETPWEWQAQLIADAHGIPFDECLDRVAIEWLKLGNTKVLSFILETKRVPGEELLAYLADMLKRPNTHHFHAAGNLAEKVPWVLDTRRRGGRKEKQGKKAKQGRPLDPETSVTRMILAREVRILIDRGWGYDAATAWVDEYNRKFEKDHGLPPATLPGHQTIRDAYDLHFGNKTRI